MASGNFIFQDFDDDIFLYFDGHIICYNNNNKIKTHFNFIYIVLHIICKMDDCVENVLILLLILNDLLVDLDNNKKLLN
jgi:hypothetical protein